MKRVFTMFLMCCFILASLMTTGCGDERRIKLTDENGVTTNHKYETYGLFNKDSKKNPNVRYEIIIGNVVWSALLFESVFFPIYFIGFSLYEPIGPQLSDGSLKGVKKY